ncbi:hypothetical protein Mapa_008202 [Marchantia paleacea]|nr:hypothetical protein Mapa_008202 [Marchantia paleacea]
MKLSCFHREDLSYYRAGTADKYYNNGEDTWKDFRGGKFNLVDLSFSVVVSIGSSSRNVHLSDGVGSHAAL